jgi:trehalose 6-phosphate synthase
VITASGLSEIVSRTADGAKVIVVSNREPYMHERAPEGVRVVRPAGGMITALEPIVRAVGGTWIAHGSGSADRLAVDADSRVRCPPEAPRFTLRRVWLTKKEERGYYYGLANSALWPLCHIVYTRPHFSREEWLEYRSVNARFCEVVLEEAGDGPAIVFVQDYHLSLLPRMLKAARPELKVALFWHIPWPNREAFRIFPWGEELLDGLLGADLLGFHIQYHCNNFLDTVDRGIEALVDYEHFRVYRGGHPTSVRPFPISVDYEQIGKDSSSPLVNRRGEAILREIDTGTAKPFLFVGTDRIDYTKGITERLRAFDLLLTRNPDLRGRVVLLQLAAPSRTVVEAYRKLNEELDACVNEVNWRHQTDDWQPVRFFRGHHDYYAVLAACRLADAVVVTSLHDGMNLVAKEFVSARTDGDGILILSRYTGAARELGDAILVNPFDLYELAEAMEKAFCMAPEERRQRMEKLRSGVERNGVYDWGARIFEEIGRVTTQGEIL